MNDQPITDTSIAARLERLEAERDIVSTLHAYGHAIDAGDEERWLDCFTDDGRFSASGHHREKLAFDVHGRDALAAFIAAHTRRPEVFHQHLVLEPVIRLDGERATCVSYFLVLMRHERTPRIRAFGRYEDVLDRGDDGAWRFRHRHANIDGAEATLPPIAFARGATP